MKQSVAGSSDEPQFGQISQGTFSGSSAGGWSHLFDAGNGKHIGRLAFRCCAFNRIRRYLAIEVNGVSYETATLKLGGSEPWKAEFYHQGRPIGKIAELPFPEMGWFRKQFLIRNFKRTLEVFRDDGSKFAQFSFDGPISSRTVIQLELAATNPTIGVAVSGSPFQKKMTRAFIGPEIDSLGETSSRELCFVTAMWIRLQMFQLGFGF